MEKANKKVKKQEMKTVSPGGIVKQTGETPANLVFHQLILRNIDRTQQDVASYRLAHKMAEAVITPTRRRLWDLLEDVKIDGTIRGAWKKRVSGVTNKKLFFSRNGVKDESFDSLLKSRNFRMMRKKRMESESFGLVGFEFVPGKQFAWKEINRKHIRPEHNLITIDPDGFTGFDYQQADNIIVWQGEELFGFMLYAAPYSLFKRNNYSDWAQYIEVFGQPVIITKYDGYDEKTRMLLEDALNKAGSSLRMMLPKQAEFDIKDGKTSNGDGKLQDTFKDAMNNEILVLILGNVETTTNDNGGSNAKGKVQQEQQLEITKVDMQDELEFMNDPKFLSILRDYYQYNTDGVEVKYEDEVDNNALKTELEIDKLLEDIGVPLGDDYYYHKYNRPKPANYDKLKKTKRQITEQIIPTDDNPDPDPDDKEDKKDDDEEKKPVSKRKKGLLAILRDFFTEAP